MRNEHNELSSVSDFVQQAAEAGELELWDVPVVERDLLELKQAMDSKDYHLVMALVGKIAKKVQR